MPGGIISGTGLYGETAFNKTPASTIIVPTVLQVAQDMISSITGLTCFYDRYWYNRADIMTFPVCFFYVKKIEEVLETEVSQKRIMLYEPQKQDNVIPFALDRTKDLSNPVRQGVMQTVVDNAVNKPKSYNMEIILPFMPISNQFGWNMNVNLQIIQSFAEMFGADVTIMENIAAVASSLVKVGQLIANTITMFPQANGANFINKNSLEAMWQARRIVVMKMWSGYDYKYVMITNCVINKDGKEDDVFRATLKLQEMPVLSIQAVAPSRVPGVSVRNWAATAVQAVQGALLALPIAATGVKTAAGEAETISIPVQ